MTTQETTTMTNYLTKAAEIEDRVRDAEAAQWGRDAAEDDRLRERAARTDDELKAEFLWWVGDRHASGWALDAFLAAYRRELARAID